MTADEQAKLHRVISDLVSSQAKAVDAPASASTHFSTALVALMEIAPGFEPWDDESREVIDWAQKEMAYYRGIRSREAMSPPLPTKLVRVIDNEAVGRMMRAERMAAGLSLRSIARALSLSAPYVSDLELGRRGWTEERAAAYREALKP